MNEELIVELTAIWKELDFLRFGQLLDDILASYRKKTGKDPFYATDEEFLKFLCEFDVSGIWR